MGYNRSGARRTERLKRHKREMERLAAKHASAPQAGEEHHAGLGEKVKGVAQGVMNAVGSAVKSAVEKVTGKES